VATLVNAVRKRLQSDHAERWREHSSSKEPTEFFHYTSAQGLKGILESKSFFASDVLSLNDYSEVVHGRDMFFDLLKAKSTALAENLLQALQTGNGLLGLGEKWFVYVFCLCAKKDVLSQWRGYSGGTGGFAIGLDAKKLEERIQQADFAVLKMLYNRKDQQRILSETLSSFERVCEEYPPQSKTDVTDVLEEMALILLQTILYFKHPAFHEEEEWRIVKIEPSDPAAFRLRGSEIVPYITVHFEPDLLKTILHGPGLSTPINDTSIRRLADQFGYDHVTIEKSDIPLR
jgi:hypothetical protein